MPTRSSLALATALALGCGGLALSQPAHAAKKEEKQQGLQLSPNVLKAAQTAQTALGNKDYATAEPAVAQAEAAATTDNDKFIAASLRYNLEMGKIAAAQQGNPSAPVNQTVLATPLDALIANPNTPAADRARYLYQRGTLSYNGKQWPQALQYLQQAQQAGFTGDPDLPLQIVVAKVNAGDPQSGLADLDRYVSAETAAGRPVREDIYRFAIARANQAKLQPQTVDWMQRYVRAYPTAKNWRDLIVFYGLASNSIATLDRDQKVDLYRLMRATNSLADQGDYENYARIVLDRGLPTEGQAVLKEGQSSGKIPASSTVARSMLAEANKGASNEGSLSGLEQRAGSAANGKLAQQTGDAYLSQGNYAKAAGLYRTALQKGGVDADEVNTHLGIALARSGDKAGAQAAFAAVRTAPRTGIASLWTTWLQTQA